MALMSQTTETDLQELIDSDIVAVAKNNPKKIIERFFRIVDKYGNVVPFTFNDAQAEYYEQMTYRDDILKARKEGFSSMILAMWAVKFLFLENVNCVCISHEDESTKRLFQKVEFYIENMSLDDGTKIKVHLHTKSKKEMVYKFTRVDENGHRRQITNTFYLGTAGSKSFGRGDNIHYLHMSETAFWDNYSRIATGLMNAVPDDRASTCIVKESTANGAGNQHHNEWKSESARQSAFTPHFFGWHKDPVNTLATKEYEERTGVKFVLTPEEEALALQHDLTFNQLAWRRFKISSMQPDDKHTKEDLFHQEFPIDASEAFLSSGKSIFDSKTREWYKEAIVMKPKMVGELVGWSPPFFQSNDSGLLKLWKEPVPDRHYVIGADVAEKGDYSIAVVIDRKTMEQVAEWHGHEADEFTFASLLSRLGYYYNTALIGCERNNMGVAVVRKLDELHYPNQYVRHSIDEITQTVSNEYGWRTDSSTRPIMISDLNQEFTARRYLARSSVLLDQMDTFIRNKSGRPEAMSGCHDDCFVGGTLVRCVDKNIAIEDVSIGDRVLTRNGYKVVIAKRSSKKHVITRFGLTGTPSHPFITNRGVVALTDIRPYDTLHAWNEKLCCIEERNIIDILTQKEGSLQSISGSMTHGGNPLFHCIDRYGKTITELLKKGLIYIIKTATHLITKSRILKNSQQVNMRPYTCLTQCVGRCQATMRKNMSSGSLKAEKSGEQQKKHMISWLKTLRGRYMDQCKKVYVSFVEKALNLLEKWAQSVVPLYAEQDAGEQTVYNIQVEDVPEYFVNNMLVHNCIIAHAIALQMYKFLPEDIKDDKIVAREYEPNTSYNNFLHR